VAGRAYNTAVPAQLSSAIVQIFAKDVQRSIAFYRLLGLPVLIEDEADDVLQVGPLLGDRTVHDGLEFHGDYGPGLCH